MWIDVAVFKRIKNTEDLLQLYELAGPRFGRSVRLVFMG